MEVSSRTFAVFLLYSALLLCLCCSSGTDRQVNDPKTSCVESLNWGEDITSIDDLLAKDQTVQDFLANHPETKGDLNQDSIDRPPVDPIEIDGELGPLELLELELALRDMPAVRYLENARGSQGEGPVE
jgi:hypothetical protein